MKAVAYLRVSKEEEDIENQRMAIKKFARERGYTIKKFFEDIDVSGWTTQILEREGFKRMLEFMRNEGIDTIIIYDVTRFGRNWKDVEATYQYLEEKGIRIYFVLQPFLNKEFFEKSFRMLEEPLRSYLSDKVFYDTLHIFASFAELESVMISVRTKQGLKKARAQGKRIGRAPLPEDVRARIIELYEKGYTYEKIRKAILKEKIYKGKDGKAKAPGLGTISDIIAEWEQSKRNKEKLAR